jgi:uncharacterized protein YndB with AHSA1/START domain
MTNEVRVTHRYAFPRERVFDAWLDPKRAARFLFATPTGEVIRCEIDPRVGGRIVVVDRRPDMGDVEHVATIVELDRPRRLVFDFAVPAYEPRETRVRLDFNPTPEGCEIVLTHQGVDDEYTEQTHRGWGMILSGLEAAV